MQSRTVNEKLLPFTAVGQWGTAAVGRFADQRRASPS